MSNKEAFAQALQIQKQARKYMSVYDEYEPKQSSLYLKLQDGEMAVIRIIGEPIIFKKPDMKGILVERAGYTVVHYEKKGSETIKTPKAWEVSGRTYVQIRNLVRDEEWGDPEGYRIKVTREGSGTDTKYLLVPSTKSPLPAEDIALVQEKLDIKKIFIRSGVEVLRMPGGDEIPETSGAPAADEYDPFADEWI